MIRRAFLFPIVLILVAGLVVRRYEQLRIEFDNTRFFLNAGMALSLCTRGDLQSPGLHAVEELKTFPQNPLPRLHTYYPQIPIKALIDPFLPKRLSNRYLNLEYGYVEHAEWTPPLVGLNDRPVWFIYGCGPAQVAPGRIDSASGDGVRVIRFETPPYQPSNGLFSQGYLYADSLGNRLGKIH